MYVEGLAKYEKDRVLTEIPPVKDEKGEVTEVQVLEEGEIPGECYETPPFDPDDFLDKLDKLQPQSFKYECPRCLVPMVFGEVKQSNGNTWRYYKCPTKNWDTKCFVTCSADEVSDYLKRVERQMHACYRQIDPARFRCECDLSPWYWPPPTRSTTQTDSISSAAAAAATSSNGSIIPPDAWPKTFSLTETGYVEKELY